MRTMSKNTKNTPATSADVDVVDSTTGPILAAEDLAIIERISNGEAVENVDISALDHSVMVGLHSALDTADSALTDVAGYLGAALQLKTWQRVAKSDNTPYTSELDFIETQINAHPVVRQILEGTAARQAVVAAVGTITDKDGKPVGLRRMGELLGVSKSQIALDKAAAAQGASGAEGGERGPQTGGQDAPTKTSVKRHVSGFEAAGVRVRDDLASMDTAQVLKVIEDARDTLSAAIAQAKLVGVELPDWAVDLAPHITPKPRLKSGAEGTTATGPALKGAPVDPTATVAPAKPGPKPRAAAAS